MSSLTLLPRARRAALAAAAITLGAVALSAPAAHAALTPSTIDPATGFPYSYTDDVAGLSLALCVDGPPWCINTPIEDPTQPVSVPDNFAPDGEAFWWDAEASLTTGRGGNGLLVLAQEATFDTQNGAPAAGHQIGFARIRVKASNLVEGATYTITHPYGVDTAEADDTGKIFVTEDVGCLSAPCSFAPATGRMSTFLRWDPTAPPAVSDPHYIGDPSVPHKVIGSPNDTNVFRIEGPDAGGPGVDVVETDLFNVQGKIAGDPPAPAPHPIMDTHSLAFPSRQVGAASAAKTVKVTNHGTADLKFDMASIGGTDAADFQVTADGCSGQAIAPAASCSVSITFTPTATGDRAATLALPDNSPTSPHAVALSGTATPGPPPTPIIVVTNPPATGGAAGAATGAAGAAGTAGAPAKTPATSAVRGVRVTTLRASGIKVPRTVRRAKALRPGLTVRFRVPSGARVGRVDLMRGSRRVASATVKGTGVKTVRFRRTLALGRYTVRIRVGTSLASLGSAVSRSVRIIR